MRGSRTFPGIRRATALAAVLASGLFLVGVPIVAAGSPDVSIVERDEVYHFQPRDITIGVGQRVTWTNDSDAPHTVTSDGSGPMDGSVPNEGDTYQATFDTVGDFAYHCEVHDYMHGTVHVAAVPPTDAATTPNATTAVGGTSQLLLAIASLGVLLVLGALRRRMGAADIER
jgi:plastocyanin